MGSRTPSEWGATHEGLLFPLCLQGKRLVAKTLLYSAMQVAAVPLIGSVAVTGFVAGCFREPEASVRVQAAVLSGCVSVRGSSC